MLDTRVSVRAHRDQRAGRLPLNPNKYLKLGSQEIPQFPKRKVSYPVFFVRSHPHKHRHSFERHRRGRVVLVLVGARSCPVYSELPNILGNFDGYFDFKTAIGVFATSNPNDTIQALTTGVQGNHDIEFNASRINAIFGSSDTVQPKTLRSYALIRYE